MRLRAAFLSTAMLLVANLANAEVAISGSTVLRGCNSVLNNEKRSNSLEQGECLGTIAAIMTVFSYIATLPASARPPTLDACLPDEATVGQVVRITVKWLEENPEYLHLAAAQLAMNAVRDAFPCR
ncbi:MAG: Rap1a/Tai family immunity protein [Panacagrimonas sp.]